MEVNTPKRMLDVAEAAKLIGVSRDTVYSMVRIRQEGFPFVRVRNRILIPKDSLLEWLGTNIQTDKEYKSDKDILSILSVEKKKKIKKLLHEMIDAIFE